jgi:hypothetical protein
MSRAPRGVAHGRGIGCSAARSSGSRNHEYGREYRPEYRPEYRNEGVAHLDAFERNVVENRARRIGAFAGWG